MNVRLMQELSGSRPDEPVPNRARRILFAASALLLLLDVALVALGAVLLVTGTIAVKAVGLVVLLIGVECRVRVPRIEADGVELSRTDAPHLFAVIEQARAAVGAPPIDRVFVDAEYNAYCGRSGLRRAVVLGLGMSLWGSLSPAARMGLLGHELGHLVNRDPLTAVLSQPAVATCGRLADLFDPRGMVPGSRVAFSSVNRAAGQIAYALYPVHVLFRTAHLWLLRVAARDHQYAETYADALAVRLAGTDGAAETLRALLFEREALAALQRCAATGSNDPEQWRAAAARSLARMEHRLHVMTQLSLRMEASAYATHPPAGMRVRVVDSWPHRDAMVEIPSGELALADAELARFYRSAGRLLVERANF